MSPAGPEVPRDSTTTPWRHPQLGISGFERYLHTLRERLPLIVAVALANHARRGPLPGRGRGQVSRRGRPPGCAGRPGDDTALTGLPVIHESSDPTRDVETASRLVESREVAVRVKRGFSLDESVGELLGAVLSDAARDQPG